MASYYVYNQPYGNQPPPGSMRRQQIDWLQQKFRGFMKETRPGEMFELPVKTPSVSCTCILTLPPGFPEQRPPYVQVTPRSQHPWVNEQGYVMHPAFLSWNPATNVSLVLDEIVKELDRFAATMRSQAAVPPPMPGMSAAVPPPMGMPPPPGGFPPAMMPPPPGPMPPPPARMPAPGPALPPHVTPPPVPSHHMPSPMVPPGMPSPVAAQPTPPPKPAARPATPPSRPCPYPEVEKLSASELQELLDNDAKFKDFFYTLAATAHVKSVLDDAKKANVETAKANLSKEAELREARERLATLHEELERLTKEREELDKQLNEATNKYTARSILQALTEAASKSDEQTEEIANEFMDGTMDVKEFIQQFKHARTVYHYRAAKAERLQERLEVAGQ